MYVKKATIDSTDFFAPTTDFFFGPLLLAFIIYYFIILLFYYFIILLFYYFIILLLYILLSYFIIEGYPVHGISSRRGRDLAQT
jgi:hypothetical protein